MRNLWYASVGERMSMTLTGLRDRHVFAVQANWNSKQRMTRSDRILRNEWRKVWPDLSVTESEPTVENVYLEAAEDKAASASSILPTIDVPPRRATRKDRSDKNAELSRRVFVSLAQNSALDAAQFGFYLDWFVYGLPAACVWKDFDDPVAAPYLVRLQPRHVYPIAWSPTGELREGLIIRRRRLVDLIGEYGQSNPAFTHILRSKGKLDEMYQEVWWADETEWGMAIGSAPQGIFGDMDYVRPDDASVNGAAWGWLREPTPHRLNGCPIMAYKVQSADGEIRGKLDPMLPPLKIAHALNLEVMLNIRRSVHAPPLVQNVENYDEYGPDVQLRGVRGPDKAIVEYPRPPANFEAFAHVKDQIDAARNAVHFPQQRGGEPGASIASGEAVTLLQGGYNSQQAHAQMDMARFYTTCFSRLACADEQWTVGSRDIDGFDSGEAFTDTYTPSTFWKGDYRVLVTFGALGVDAHTNLLNMGVMSRLGWLSDRTAIEKSGVVPNALIEERRRSMSRATRQWEEQILPTMVERGDTDTFHRYYKMIDDNKETPTAAMLALLGRTVREAAGNPQNAPPPQVTPELLSLLGGRGGMPGQPPGMGMAPPGMAAQ